MVISLMQFRVPFCSAASVVLHARDSGKVKNVPLSNILEGVLGEVFLCGLQSRIRPQLACSPNCPRNRGTVI